MNIFSDSNISYAWVEKIPLDMECKIDIDTGKGIRIFSVESFNKKNEKEYHGLQSDFFGADFNDPESSRMLYKCKCGKYVGNAYRGYVCENCDTPVEYNGIDLEKTGWIIIDNFYVIHPIYHAKLGEALGKYDQESVIDKIISTDYADKESGVKFNDREALALKKHPFLKKGMIWLHENLDTVLDYYAARKPNKADLFNELRNEKDKIWTHSIPVYPAVLRYEMPDGEKGSKSYKLKINTIYRSIIRLSNAINSIEEEDYCFDIFNNIDIKLAAIQREIGQIFDQTYQDLTYKNGVLNAKVISGRYNFSTRDIIIPSSGILRSDEVEMGYIPFLELFRYEITNFISKLKNCTIKEASNIWKKACNHFDNTVYSIMEYMTTDKEMRKYLTVLINRNPSINYGSFDFMRVVRVHKDITDKTLVIPSHILRPMNADFDGDQENVYRIISYDIAKKFEKNMNPRYNLFISRMNGLINPEMLPMSEEITTFWAFNNL